MPVRISAMEIVNAPLAQTFDAACAIDPRDLIRKHGPLPAIVDVDGHDAPWSAVGQVRRHALSDNSSVNEELDVFDPNETFAYRLSGFTGAFAPLVREAHAEWDFTKTSEGKTRIDWTYAFAPTGPIAEPVLWFIVKLFWPGYLKSALGRVKEKAESAST